MGIERAKVDAGLALLAESLATADKATATAACTLIKEVPEPHARTRAVCSHIRDSSV
jgi:hypothetical protein